MRKTKYKIACFVLALLMVIPMVVGACADGDDVAVSEWHIPVCLFLTGPFAGQGISAQWITEAAADEINAAGGIAGKPVVLDIYDTGLDPEKATTAMSQVIDANALVSIGPWMETEALAAMPLAMRESIFVVPVGPESVVEQSLPWTVYLDFQREDMRQVMRMWHEAVPDMQASVAFCHSVLQETVLMMEIEQDELEALGVTSNGIIDVAMDTVDFSAPVVKALGTGADTFFLQCTPDVGAKLVIELVERGVDPSKIFVGDGQCDSAFIQLTEGYNEGIYCNASLTYDYKDKWTELNTDYAATHDGDQISVRWYEFYDALYLIKAAIEEQGITGDLANLQEERADIKDYISNVNNFDGCKFTYDIVDNFARMPLYLFQMHDNIFELVNLWTPS